MLFQAFLVFCVAVALIGWGMQYLKTLALEQELEDCADRIPEVRLRLEELSSMKLGVYIATPKGPGDRVETLLRREVMLTLDSPGPARVLKDDSVILLEPGETYREYLQLGELMVRPA